MLRTRLINVKNSIDSVLLAYWRALIICPALFVYIFSNDINIISLNSLVYRKLCLNEFNETICNSLRNYAAISNHLQETTSSKMILLNVGFLVPAIFSIIRLASIADRKLNYELPLLISLIGSLAQAFLNIFAVDLSYSYCFNLLIFSQFMNGILGGGSLAFISSCFSHIALYEVQNGDKEITNSLVEDQASAPTTETTKHEHRSIRYSICESCLLLGQFLGNLASGYLIGNKREIKKFRQTYIISFALYFIVLIYILVLFCYLKKEKKLLSRDYSKSTDQMETSDTNFADPKKEFRWKHLIDPKRQFYFVFEAWQLLFKPRTNKARFYLNSLLILYFFGASISMGILSPVQYLYMIKKPIYFSQVNYGIFKAFNTLFRAISLLVLLPIAKYYFSMPDHVLFFAGLASELLNLVVFAVASINQNIIWIAPVVYMFSNYYVVCIRSLGSKLVQRDEIGKYFAVIAIVEFLVLLISSTIFQLIYKATVASFPTLVFLIGSVICLVICLPLLIYIVKEMKQIN